MESHFAQPKTALRRALHWSAVLVVALFATMPLIGQSAAHIDGTVTDQTGAVVPKAKITALNVKTQEKRIATSNDNGIFSVTNVSPGVYDITIEATNFQKEVIQAVEINVGEAFTANVKLQVGTTSETVEVKASEVQVQTTDAQIGSDITMREIDTLPSLGRTPVTLAVFQPGVQINPGDTSFSHVNGTRQGSNNTTLDGIDVNDSVTARLGLTLTANNTDSVGEFRIVTEGGKAEYGRSAGGQVELLTRQGTNDFHGNGFDYLRNTDLNANDFFNNQSGGDRPKFIQNTFGGSFGGPIKHNRTFIFGNYQGQRTRQQTVRNRTILSPQARTGLFQWKDSSGTLQSYNIAANDPRGIGVDKMAAASFAQLPAACNNSDVGDGLNTCGFRFNNPSNSYNDQFTIRGDQVITNSNKAFLRWSWQRNSSIDALNNADATYPGQVPGTQGGHRWGFSIGDSHTFSSTFLNDARVGYQSAQVAFNRPARPQGPAYVTNLLNPDPISSTYAQGRNSPVIEIADTLTKITGSHTVKWGTTIYHTKEYGYNDAGIWYNLTTSSTANGDAPTIPAAVAGATTTAQQTVFQQLYNDVLGRVDNIAHTAYSTDLSTYQAAGTSRVRNYIRNEMGYFVQDDWRFRRNLTLSVGLRYDLFLQPTEMNGIQAALDNAAGVTPVNQLTNLTVRRGGWFSNDYNNLAPRFGFAYDPFGDGKTSLRGNVGIFYDRDIGATESLADGGTPGFSSATTFKGLTVSTPQTLTQTQLNGLGCSNAVAGDVRASDCLSALLPVPSGPPVVTLPVANRTTTIDMFNPNLRTGYLTEYSLGVQREIAHNTILDVKYIGNRGIKLFMDEDYNQVHAGKLLGDFQALQITNNSGNCTSTAFKCGALPSASNQFVQMFMNFSQAKANLNYAPAAGVPCSGQANPLLCASAQAIAQLGASNFTNGAIGSAVNTLDRSFNNLYAPAGFAQTFLRNYPQFNNVVVGTNDGRSYYDALQVSVRRSAGALRVDANYTYGKALDNTSSEGNGFTSPVDNFNNRANRSLADFDHRNSFNMSFLYTLPVGNGKTFGGSMPKWLDTLVGGWDIGSLLISQDGLPFTVSSQRLTFGNDGTTFANFAGSTHDIGEPRYVVNPATGKTNVFFFTPAQASLFTFPAAGTLGTSGRNGFRGPKYFDVDMSLVKRFKITERQSVTFRAEAYNALNNPNFTLTGGTATGNNVNLNTPASFGQLSGTTGPAGTSARNLQLTLRYDF